MSKYGFVYIWRDRKRKMYYIGCHWGTEDDGYICSSRRMGAAYKKRPWDFKRRILKKTQTKEELFRSERYWLSFIQDNELSSKYYNLTKILKHWSEYDSSSVRSKISKSVKKYMESLTTEERINKYSNKTKRFFSENERKQMSERAKQRWKRVDSEQRSINGMFGKTHSEETKRKISEGNKGKVRSEKTKNLLSKKARNYQTEETKRKISQTMKNKTKPKIKCPYCQVVSVPGLIHRWHFENCRHKND